MKSCHGRGKWQMALSLVEKMEDSQHSLPDASAAFTYPSCFTCTIDPMVGKDDDLRNVYKQTTNLEV